MLVLPTLLALASSACSGGVGGPGPDVAGPPATDGAGTETVTVPSTTTTTTTTTLPTTTTPTTTTPTTAPVATALYQPTSAPVFPSRSTAPPASGLPDGAYYAVVRGASAGAPSPRLAVRILQLLTGDEAIAAAQADGHGLDSDIYVPERPAADRDIDLQGNLFISVAKPDRPDVSYQVPVDELVRLVNGAPPGAGAPDGYRYVPFPVLITVTGGAPTRVEQLWSP